MRGDVERERIKTRVRMEFKDGSLWGYREGYIFIEPGNKSLGRMKNGREVKLINGQWVHRAV